MSDFAKYCLFNFSASINGGGLKRLEEYSKWFDERGGSIFIISDKIKTDLETKFENNTYFKVKQSFWDRVFRDQSYIRNLPIDFDEIKFYYSYGIPVYEKIGDVNCFHVSNIAPFKKNVEKSFVDNFRNYLLKKRFINYLDIPEIISAESNSSFNYLPSIYYKKFLCLQNGSDDEINFEENKSIRRENIAVTVGTHPYKRLDRVIDCFKYISKNYEINDLYIFGDSRNIKIDNPNIHLMGNKPRDEVISMIAKSKFYITCTTTENSYNAASEGVFISDRSIISIIGPHEELLENETKEVININGNDMYLVERNDLTKLNIIYWNDIINKMLLATGLKE